MVFYWIQSVISRKFTCALCSCKKTTLVVSLLNWPQVLHLLCIRHHIAVVFLHHKIPTADISLFYKLTPARWSHRTCSNLLGAHPASWSVIRHFWNDGTSQIISQRKCLVLNWVVLFPKWGFDFLDWLLFEKLKRTSSLTCTIGVIIPLCINLAFKKDLTKSNFEENLKIDCRDFSFSRDI